MLEHPLWNSCFKRDTKTNRQKSYHRSLRSWWVCACWRTIPLWRLSRGNHSRTRRWIDRVHDRIDCIKALQVSRELKVCEKCTKQLAQSGKVHNNNDRSRWRTSPRSRASDSSWLRLDYRILQGCNCQDIDKSTLSR